MRICISGREALAEREAQERAKWNKRSLLVVISYLMCLKLAKMVSKRQPRFMIGGFSGSGSLPDGFIHFDLHV